MIENTTLAGETTNGEDRVVKTVLKAITGRSGLEHLSESAIRAALSTDGFPSKDANDGYSAVRLSLAIILGNAVAADEEVKKVSADPTDIFDLLNVHLRFNIFPLGHSEWLSLLNSLMGRKDLPSSLRGRLVRLIEDFDSGARTFVQSNLEHGRTRHDVSAADVPVVPFNFNSLGDKIDAPSKNTVFSVRMGAYAIGSLTYVKDPIFDRSGMLLSNYQYFPDLERRTGLRYIGATSEHKPRYLVPTGQSAVLPRSYKGTSNHYHQILDQMAGILFAKEANIENPVFLMNVNKDFRNKVSAIAEFLGVDFDVIIESPHMLNEKSYLETWIASPSYDLISMILERQRAKQSLLEGQGFGPDLYISRRRAERRRIDNEDALEAMLIARGYEVVFMEDLSFDEQIRTFSSARTIVTPHGAALTNLIFSRPSTRVLELGFNDYVNGLFKSLANKVGIKNYTLLYSSATNGRRIDLSEVEKALDAFHVDLQEKDNKL